MTSARKLIYPTFTFVLCMLALGFCRLEQMLMSGNVPLGQFVFGLMHFEQMYFGHLCMYVSIPLGYLASGSSTMKRGNIKLCECISVPEL